MGEDGYFNAQGQINKYSLDLSTFDLVDVDRFHNTKAGTVFSYIFMWILMILSWVWLGTDIYTCLSILVFHHWSSKEYEPYQYSVAKWIFTGCIIFQFCLLIYHWIWAIYTFKTRNIALVYVNKIAKLLYYVKSYNYFCLFNKIEQDTYFDWACFYCYEQLDNAPQILIADTPRQVINILTIRFYATDGDHSNNILQNIKNIANSNLTLAVILSLMCLSIVIWCIFFFMFVWGALLYLYVKPRLLKLQNHKTLKKYCCKVVNEKVRMLVLKNHKSKKELLERGILEKRDIKMNPLLNTSTTSFSLSTLNQPGASEGYEYRAVYDSQSRIQKPNPIHKSNTFAYNDNKKLYDLVKHENQSYESISLTNLSKGNPFTDSNRLESQDLLLDSNSSESIAEPYVPHRKAPSPLSDPFTNSSSTEGFQPPRSNSPGVYAPPRSNSPNLHKQTSQSSFDFQQPKYVPLAATRKASASSLTFNSNHEPTHDDVPIYNTYSTENRAPTYNTYAQSSEDLGYGLKKPQGSFDYGSSSNLIEQRAGSEESLSYPIREDLYGDHNHSESDDDVGLPYPASSQAPYPIRGLSVYDPTEKYEPPSKKDH